VALMWNRTVEWDDGDWRHLAACRSTEPDLFFPIGTTGPAVDQIEAAKRVCRGCDAQEPCLDFALATNQESVCGAGPRKRSAASCARRGWRRVAGPPEPDAHRSEAGPLQLRGREHDGHHRARLPRDQVATVAHGDDPVQLTAHQIPHD
jgi:WhiB family redox-sensing transcriptional regulator